MKQNALFKNMRRTLPLCLVCLVAGLTSCNNDLETSSTLENSYGEGMVNSLDDRNKAPNDRTNAVSNEEGNIIFKLCDATLNPFSRICNPAAMRRGFVIPNLIK